MTLDLKTISVGSETGVQDIQSNFSAIKTVVESVQNSLSSPAEVVPFTDFKCLNGTNNGTAGNTHTMWMYNFSNFQILFYGLWINNINLTTAWAKKDVLSIPLKYFKFKYINFFSDIPSNEIITSGTAFSSSLDRDTGILNVSLREKAPLDGCWVRGYAILSDTKKLL